MSRIESRPGNLVKELTEHLIDTRDLTFSLHLVHGLYCGLSHIEFILLSQAMSGSYQPDMIVKGLAINLGICMPLGRNMII